MASDLPSEKTAAPEASTMNASSKEASGLSAPAQGTATHLSPRDAKAAEGGAVSGASSIAESGLEKQKTHPDDEAGHTAAAAKTKTNQSAVSRVVARVATSAELPQAFRLVAIMIALALAMFLAALDMTIVATAIPSITDEFHSLNDVGWYGSAFFLTIAAFQAFWGKLYKFFPLKTSYLAAIAVFEVGSLICAVARNSVTLIVGRAIAGLGAAGIASGVYIIIAFSAAPERRAVFTGILGAVYGIASVVGPLIGGVFTQYATWRWCFYVNLPIGGVAAAVIILTFHAPPAAKPQEASLKEKLLQMDLPGTFVILSAIICFLLAIQWGGVTLPWSDKTVIGLLVGFGVLVILFIAIQYVSGDRAIIPGRLMKNRNILVSSIYASFFGGSFFLLLYYLPIYFQSVDGVSASQSGIRNLPLVIGASIFSIISGGLITAFGQVVPIFLLGGILSAIADGLLYTLDIGSTSSQWIGYQALAGFGVGLGIQAPIITGQASVEMSDISSVTAIILFFQTIGGAIWVQAGQSAFTNTLGQRLPEFAPNVSPEQVLATGASEISQVFQGADLDGILRSYMAGLRVSYAIAIALSCAAAVTALFLRWKSIRPPKPGAVGAA